MLYPCWPPYSYQNSHLEFKIQCIFNSVWKLFPVTKFYLLFFLRICVNNFIKALEKYIGLTALDFSFSRPSSLKSLFSQLFPMGWHLDIQYVSGFIIVTDNSYIAVFIKFWEKHFYCKVSVQEGFPGSSVGRESTCNAGDPGLIPGLGRSPGGGHGNLLQSILAWRIPWTEESGRLQFMGSQRLRHDWAAKCTHTSAGGHYLRSSFLCCCLVTKSCPTAVSMEFRRQEDCSGLSFLAS